MGITIPTLPGKKTYIALVAYLAVVAAEKMGYLPAGLADTLQKSLLGLAGMAMRNAITTKAA